MNARQRIPQPADEADRLSALRQYQLLDTDREPDFDLLAELAAQACDAPFAFISLVDEHRVWYKSAHGRRVTESVRDQDYCAWTILEDQMLHVPDLTLDARTAQMPLTRDEPGYRMYCGANLVTSAGQKVGALCVLDTRARQLSGVQQQLLMRLSGLVVKLMELRLRDRQLQAALDDMRRLANEDGLTGLLNRRAILAALASEVERDQRFGTGLAVLMIDIDHFKQVNDGFGHAMGDAVLRGVGGTLREGLRSIDRAGRYGGEELCVLLPGTGVTGALKVAESLRAAIAAGEHLDGDSRVNVSVSIGAAASEQGISSADALLRAADGALYRAKHAGRNRVLAWQAAQA